MKDKNTFDQNSVEPFVIFVDDETDNKTGETGLASTLQTNMTLSKNGGAFVSVAPVVAEIGNGWYSVTPIAAHRDTIGPAVWRTTATGANSVEKSHRIIEDAIGELDDAAAAGDPTNADTLMQYVKQLVNVLTGSAGVGTFPGEAAPADGVSLAEVIRAIHADVTGLNGAAMRGTDSANTTTPPTTAQIRDAILDRILSGNHDTATTLGKIIQDLETELAKVPRLGSTHKHRQISADTGNKSADVAIEAAS